MSPVPGKKAEEVSIPEKLNALGVVQIYNVDSIAILKTFLMRQMFLLKGLQFKRITLYGHCGGKNTPGVDFKDGGERFELATLDKELVQLIQKILTKDGIFVICNCNYRDYKPTTTDEPDEELIPTDDGQKKAWDTNLQRMANKLGRTVCACTGRPAFEALVGCRAASPKDGGKMVCATAEPS